MKEEDVRPAMQAYLDRQLDPAERARFEACCEGDPALKEACCEGEAFHKFLKQACCEPAPAGLRERLAAKLWQAPRPHTDEHEPAHPLRDLGTHIPEPRERHAPSHDSERRVARMPRYSRSLALAAAVLLAVSGVAFVAVGSRFIPECHYILACEQLHQRVMNDPSAIRVASGDPSHLVRFVSAESKVDLPCVPCLKEYGLAPTAAGVTPLPALQPYNAPQGVFVKYEHPQLGPLTLLIHNWKESPDDMNLDPKLNLWTVDHDGMRVVMWKCPARNLTCALVGHRSLDQMIQMANLARNSMAH